MSDRLDIEETARLELERSVRARTAELTRTNALLLEEVRERGRAEAELRRTQDDLIQASKLAALGQLAAGLSHELNQPLAAIRGYADNAAAYLSRGEPTTAATNLAAIAELTERMARIVRNLRIYARREVIATRPVDPRSALADALALLEPRIASERARVSVGPFASAPAVMAGEVRLQQILVNLIGNALDAVRDAERREIEITLAETPEEVSIAVADSGPGVASEHLPRLFDPFFTTKRVGEGTGLGLSISLGLAREFGGRLTAQNRSEGGAVFVLSLPRAAAAAVDEVLG